MNSSSVSAEFLFDARRRRVSRAPSTRDRVFLHRSQPGEHALLLARVQLALGFGDDQLGIHELAESPHHQQVHFANRVRQRLLCHDSQDAILKRKKELLRIDGTSVDLADQTLDWIRALPPDRSTETTSSSASTPEPSVIISRPSVNDRPSTSTVSFSLHDRKRPLGFGGGVQRRLHSGHRRVLGQVRRIDRLHRL